MFQNNIFNQKGDFILYIIVTILVIFVGAILYYMYLEPENNTSTITDSNFISEFKSKMPEKEIIETYPNTYKIYAKLDFDMKLELQDKNIIFEGNPKIIVSEREFNLIDPILSNFSGYLDNTGIYGSANKLFNKSAHLDLRSEISSNYEDIDKIEIEDTYFDLEQSNTIGIIKVQDREFNLNKGYLKIKGFLGKATIKSTGTEDNKKMYVELDGNIGYLKIIDNGLETVLK